MGHAYYAVRRGNWKLLQNAPGEPFQLFDLSNDPLEQVDLAGKNRKKYNELGALLRRHIQRSGRVPWQKPER
jgi:arylsulfatase A-like enzyme